MTTRPARRPVPPGRQRAAATAGILTTAVATGAVLLAVTYSTGRAPTPEAGPEPPASLATASVAAPIPSGPATELSSEGAKAFVPYWFTTLDHALRTGDTSALAAASDTSCTSCADAIAAITEGYREGGTIRDAGYVVRSVNPDSFFTLDRPILRVVVDRSPGTVLGPDGTPRRTLPRFTFLSCQVALTRSGETWTVSDLQTTAPLA